MTEIKPETVRYFTCAHCGEEYQAINTEQDAAVEMLEDCHEVLPEDERVSLCDDCYGPPACSCPGNGVALMTEPQPRD